MKNEIQHSAHSTYRLEAHIVFAPKFRRKVIYGEIKKDITSFTSMQQFLCFSLTSVQPTIK